MASIFAPPEVFSAYAVFNDADANEDRDLQIGTHVRIYAGLGASFPIAPFVVFKTQSDEQRPQFVQAVDSNGNVLGGVDLSGKETVTVSLLLNDGPHQKTVRLDLFPNGDLERASVLGSRGRVIAERVQPDWQFSGPVLDRLQLRGSATDVDIVTRMVNVENFGGFTESNVAAVLAMPLQGSHRWYAGGCDQDTAFKRVEAAEPRRLAPMDAPEGSAKDIGGHERPRIEALLGLSGYGGGPIKTLERIADDPDLPWLQNEVQELPPRDRMAPQFVTSNRLGLIQMAAADPGLARYFGFSDFLPDLPDSGWDTLAIVGLFAFSERDFKNYPLAYAALTADPVTSADYLLKNYILILEARGVGNDIRNEILTVIATAQDAGLIVAPMVTCVSPVRPWLAPTPSAPQIFQRRWHSSQNGEPSNLFRTSFAFPNMPLASLSALARRIGGGELVTRHELVDVRSDLLPPQRAAAAAFGHELEPNARLNEIGEQIRIQQTAALLSDQDIPSDQGQVSFAIRAGDCFGRFGELAGFSEFDVDPPPRPAPPPPVLRFHFVPDDLPPTSVDERSPGHIDLTVAIPDVWPNERFDTEIASHLGSSIVVPRIDDMRAGSLHLEMLLLELGDERREIVLTSPGLTKVEPIQLNVLAPQQPGHWTLRGRYLDSAGRESAVAELVVSVTDRRPPPVYKTGIGLFWADAPGPAPDVEVRLRWPAPANSKHRVYLTDQRGLGLQISADRLNGATIDEAPRGLVAAEGCKRVLDAHSIPKSNFTLITEPPIEAGPDGFAMLRTKLPRSLATVQFLRVVPVGPDGAEPDFNACGIVPVAVPESRRPPAPLIGGRIDLATGRATLVITTSDLNDALLRREEPGLTDSAIGDVMHPQFRLRRAVGKVPDPIYASTVKTGDLRRLDTGPGPRPYSADVDGGVLEPYVRYVFWAEVQLPPERRLPVGYSELPSGVSTPDQASRSHHPRPFSAPSSPRTLLYAPATFARVPDNATASLQPVFPLYNKLTISFPDPPRAHAKAIERFRIAIWLQWDDGPIVPADNANGAPLNGVYPSVESGAVSIMLAVTDDIHVPQLKLRLAYVDPIGRLGPIVSVSV